MRNGYKLGLITIVIMVMLLGYGGFCMRDGKPESGSNVGTVSGKIIDADGQPIEGAVVVLGQNSPHTVTDPDGQFTINNVPIGSQEINVICGGYYTFNRGSVRMSSITNLGNIQIKEFAGNMDDVPQVSIDNASISGSTISITATITPGASADAITDVRAELLYYNTGKVMTLSGSNVYTATVTIPSNAAGPYLSVVVFAIDAKHKVGSAITTVSYSGGTGTGNFTLDTITGTWSGTVKYHRNYIDSYNYKRALGAEANTAITISALTTNTGTATGKCAEPRMYLLMQDASDPIETVDLSNGNVTLVDANFGIYKIQFDFTGVSRTITATLLARCDSAVTPTNLFGMMRLRETDTTTGITVTNYTGRFHFKNNISWATTDFDGSWVLSDYFGISATGEAFSSYVPPFQYNEALTIDSSGNVTTGTNTMDLDISNGSFSISDTGLGTFSAVITTSDNVATSFYGLVNIKKNFIKGIKKISSGTSKNYGYFWGPKSPTPHFNISNFASRKIGWINTNSVFLGSLRVITGPDSGKLYIIGLGFDASGNIIGGAVDTITGTRIATFSSGNVSSFDTTTGKFNATASGLGCSFTTTNRNASMGVCKVRLVGDFTLDYTGGTDSGYFFMYRLPEPQQ
ncbi:MAG: carboxypeptidase-like regulatory domain-containing protein [Planctomycetota bacterium]